MYTPAAHNSEEYVLAVWYWEGVAQEAKDLEIQGFNFYYWDEVAKNIDDYCRVIMQGRRVIDAKVSCSANGGNALGTIVSIADHDAHGFVALNRTNIQGSHEEVLDELKSTMSKTSADEFTGIAICPRDTN